MLTATSIQAALRADPVFVQFLVQIQHFFHPEKQLDDSFLLPLVGDIQDSF